MIQNFLIQISILFFSLYSAQAFEVIYSSDVMGEVEPCSCRKNPRGGLLRKDAWIESLSSPVSDRVFIDAGNLFFESPVLVGPLKKLAEEKANLMVQSLDLYQEGVGVPGRNDFALGKDYFLKLTKKSKKFHWLASNLIDEKGKTFLPATHTMKLSGKTVTFVGVVGDQEEWPKGLKASPPLEAVQKTIQSLSKQPDLVIVVSHAGEEMDQKIVEKNPKISAVFGGYTKSFFQKPKKVASALLFQTSLKNQYMGYTKYEKNAWDVEASTLVELDESFDQKKNHESLKKWMSQWQITKKKLDPFQF